MLSTRVAKLRIVGAATVALATGLAFFGVTGAAHAEAMRHSTAYCYQNGGGAANSWRYMFVNLQINGEDGVGVTTYYVEWDSYLQFWADNKYVNETDENNIERAPEHRKYELGDKDRFVRETLDNANALCETLTSGRTKYGFY
jgi:hypothetical protein